MKNFILGLSLAMFVGILGLFLVTNNLTKSSIELAKNCTWSDLKVCYYNGKPIPGNPCCPPKMMDNPVAKDCNWTEVKDCWSGNPNPNNQCCPPKYQMDAPQEISKNCTWTEVKLCYDGIPNKCCPPKNMDNPV